MALDTMIMKYFVIISAYAVYTTRGDRFYSHPERQHNLKFFTTTMNPVVDYATGIQRPTPAHTPDFRLEEPMLEPYGTKYMEYRRPYRISPHHKQTYYFPRNYDADLYGCYCTTVYWRVRLLAGCAVITTRHVLTTATSTELILSKFRHRRDLHNILGVWYDNNRDTYNSSMYLTPAQIHYHPLYTFPHKVNRTHPFPVMFDLSVWALTHTIDFWGGGKTCDRGGPHKWDIRPATAGWPSYYNIMGFQFMRAYQRVPNAFNKYTIRLDSRDSVIPCPKTEWGWYHCWSIGTIAPLGMDHGAALHRTTSESGHYRYNGLVGMNVLNMKLRSIQMLGYFIDLNNYLVLDFLYDAYNNKFEAQYLDQRFKVTYGRAPISKWHIYEPYRNPVDRSSTFECCWPERYRHNKPGK